MTTYTWNAASGFFENPSDWLGGVVPTIGATIDVPVGSLILRGAQEPQPGSYDGLTFDLGSSAAGAPADLELDDATLGSFVTIDSCSADPFAMLSSVGTSGFEGTLDADAACGIFTLQATTTDSANPADLVLLDGGGITIFDGDTVQQIGRFDDHGTVNVGSAGTLVINGTVNTADGALQVLSGGTVAGDGTVSIGMFSSFYLEQGSGASSIAVTFSDVGGRLRLGTPADYTGQVSNFLVGDIIDLTNTTADYAFAAGGTLTVRNGGSLGAIVAVLNVQGAGANGVMSVTADGGGGEYIAAGNALARTKYTATAVAKALQANLVSGDGAGIRIGIMSDSFDADPGIGAADPANADAIAGYLPLASDGTTCAVTVLLDSTGDGNTDEGRAMAEVIYQIAPQAQLYFYTADTPSDLADGITALADAGCNIIVDDLSYYTEPFFQVAGPIDSAIENAIAGGVDYFTAAGNSGDASFQADFASRNAVTTLYDGSTVDAYIFDNGTSYQTITSAADGSFTSTIYLQWDAPYPTAAASVSPVELVIDVFDNGNLVATSEQSSLAVNGVTLDIPGEDVELPGTVSGIFQIAIYSPSGAPVPGIFKYILAGSGDGTGPGGVIEDPAAEQGSGTVFGHQLPPNVNTVAAVDFADTPAYGNPAGPLEFYSSTGPGELLFDGSGNPLAPPEPQAKPDFTAPVGGATDVAGFAPFAGTSAAAPAAAALAALMLQANLRLTTTQVSDLLAQSATSLGEPAALQGAGLIQANVAVALAAAACFVAGTRIATERGEVAVENLRLGDRVHTRRERGLAPIVWIGHRRVDCRRHLRPAEVWPVRVLAGAFGPGIPHSDLWLSPDHAVYLDPVLIPVRYLINGASIAQESVDNVTYWHLELTRHEVILAQGLACESYLDTGNRGAFEGSVGWSPDCPQERFIQAA